MGRHIGLVDLITDRVSPEIFTNNFRKPFTPVLILLVFLAYSTRYNPQRSKRLTLPLQGTYLRRSTIPSHCPTSFLRYSRIESAVQKSSVHSKPLYFLSPYTRRKVRIFLSRLSTLHNSDNIPIRREMTEVHGP